MQQIGRIHRIRIKGHKQGLQLVIIPLNDEFLVKYLKWKQLRSFVRKTSSKQGGYSISVTQVMQQLCQIHKKYKAR